MQRLVFVVTLLLASFSASADEWRVAANTMLVLDWAQTREIAVNPAYYETNQSLGRNPTTNQVNRFFIKHIAITNLVGELLPSRYRNWWYAGKAAYQASFVVSNNQLGIGFRF